MELDILKNDNNSCPLYSLTSALNRKSVANRRKGTPKNPHELRLSIAVVSFYVWKPYPILVSILCPKIKHHEFMAVRFSLSIIDITHFSNLSPSASDLYFCRHFVRSCVVNPFFMPLQSNGIVHSRHSFDNTLARLWGFSFTGFLLKSILSESNWIHGIP